MAGNLCVTQNLFVMFFIFNGDELLFKRRTTLMGKRARLIKHFITTSFFNDAEREGGGVNLLNITEQNYMSVSRMITGRCRVRLLRSAVH